ncbi:MAG TPA: hypothetical protein VG964_00015 [Candidatus Saccharimonadales bacterium]|nr:hypothetical protein [Candidatus Saccharimonadales bacterium]
MSAPEHSPIDVLDEMLVKAEPHFIQVINTLKPAIVEGVYGSVLGEDVSGRFPALVIGKVMRRYARENSMRVPGLYFFAGGSMGEIPHSITDAIAQQGDDFTPEKSVAVQNMMDQLRNDNLSSYFERLKPYLGARSLVVTDQLTTGRTMYETSIALHNAEVDFDICTLAVAAKLSEYGQMYLKCVPDFSSSIISGGSRDIKLMYSSPREHGSPVLRRIIGVEKDWIMPLSRVADEEGLDRAGAAEARRILSAYSDGLYEQTFSS